jgi:hypothetical protein
MEFHFVDFAVRKKPKSFDTFPSVFSFFFHTINRTTRRGAISVGYHIRQRTTDVFVKLVGKVKKTMLINYNNQLLLIQLNQTINKGVEDEESKQTHKNKSCRQQVAEAIAATETLQGCYCWSGWSVCRGDQAR